MGPSFGHDGRTEVSLFGRMSFTGTSGRRATLLGLLILATLSIAYATAVS